jgi:hypothetical protein
MLRRARGVLRVADRVVVARRAQDAGEHRRLVDGDLADVDREEALRGRADAVGADAEVRAVEVALEDLVLRELPLDLDGVQRLLDLALVGLLGREEGELHVLLGDRRRAGLDAAGHEVRDERADDREVVDAGVLVEVRVLGREHRVDDDLRDLVERDRVAVLLERQLGDERPVGREHERVDRDEARRADVLGLEDLVADDTDEAFDDGQRGQRGQREQAAGDADDEHDAEHAPSTPRRARPDGRARGGRAMRRGYRRAVTAPPVRSVRWSISCPPDAPASLLRACLPVLAAALVLPLLAALLPAGRRPRRPTCGRSGSRSSRCAAASSTRRSPRRSPTSSTSPSARARARRPAVRRPGGVSVDTAALVARIAASPSPSPCPSARSAAHRRPPVPPPPCSSPRTCVPSHPTRPSVRSRPLDLRELDAPSPGRARALSRHATPARCAVTRAGREMRATLDLLTGSRSTRTSSSLPGSPASRPASSRSSSSSTGSVVTAAGEVELRLRPDELQVRFHSLGLLRRMLHAAATAPFVYLLLVVGLGMLLFEVFQPGLRGRRARRASSPPSSGRRRVHPAGALVGGRARRARAAALRGRYGARRLRAGHRARDRHVRRRLMVVLRRAGAAAPRGGSSRRRR